jgi:Mn2+/Fe2+ NRAMP family transporter
MWRVIGPALLFSGSAIGTSHLVQSTRAGALYGLGLLGVILVICILKYPSFRFGVDYGHSTRRSMLAGYRELGLWAPLVFVLFAVLVYPVVYAALASATAGIAIAVFGLAVPVPVLALATLVFCALPLVAGGYEWLDLLNRVLVAFLLVSTLIVTALALPRVEWATLTDISWASDPRAILFVVALAGFMPNPLEVSVTNSMWVAEAERGEGGGNTTLAEARLAFFAGYTMTAFLALCFCIIGAGVMHSAQIAPETSAPGFAQQIVDLYSETLGEGAAVLAAIAALSVMATTLLAALDIGGRNVASTYQQVADRHTEAVFKRVYRATIGAMIALTGAVLYLFTSSFTALLDLATSAVFLGAPIVATLNHLVMTRCSIPQEARPSPVIRKLNIVAIIVMTSLALAYFALTLAAP